MTRHPPLIDVTLRGLLSRRRMILLVLLAGLPVLIALLVRVGGGRTGPRPRLDTLVVRAVMPFVALILGTAALGSEIEDGTAVFLLIKLIPRWQILLSKMLVAAGLTAVLVVPSIILTGVIIGRATGDALTTTTAFAVACLVGGTAYSVAFVTLSLYTSRALLVGLGYTLIWEGVLAGLLEGHEVPVDPPGDARHRVGDGREGSRHAADAPGRQRPRRDRRYRRGVRPGCLEARALRDPRRRLRAAATHA